MKSNNIIYNIATALVILFVGVGSIADLLQVDPVKESFKSLGFPFYTIPFFGVMKIAGVLGITIPAFVRVREASYAGIFFYFIGAVYCHLAVGDGIDKLAVPAFILLTIVVSYLFNDKGRTRPIAE